MRAFLFPEVALVNRTGQSAIQALSVGGIRQTSPPTTGTLIRWANTPGHYIYTYVQNGMPQSQVAEVAGLPNCAGIALWFTWRHLEPTKNNYFFTTLIDCLDRIQTGGLKALLYMEGRSFGGTTRQCPDYLTSEVSGGIYNKLNGGTTPAYWKPQISDRDIALYEAMAAAGIADHPALTILKQSELDSGLGSSDWSPAGFTPASYMDYMRDWAVAIKAAFPKVNIAAPANFCPGGAQDMEPWVQYCYERGVGLGGPDVFPQPTSQSRGPTHTDRVIKGQHYIGGDAKLETSWNNSGFDYRGKIFYCNDCQDPEFGKGYVWYPDDFYNYCKSTTTGIGHNCMAWWRKDYTWPNRPAADQTYWSNPIQTNPLRRIKSWLQLGGHAMPTTAPTFYNGLVDA